VPNPVLYLQLIEIKKINGLGGKETFERKKVNREKTPEKKIWEITIYAEILRLLHIGS